MPAKSESLRWEDWYAHAERDLQGAILTLQYQGSTGLAAFLLQQATEKYIKGYLLKHGWILKKTHDLEFLLTKASEHDQLFTEFLDFGRILSGAYVESRYPFGPPKDYSNEQIKDWLSQTEKLIAFIKEQS